MSRSTGAGAYGTGDGRNTPSGGPGHGPVGLADEATRQSQVRRALAGSTVGTTIEWYDFFLYGTAAALVFPKVFFPGAGHYAGVLASFATYFVGFAARPLGAFIFGHYGDRLGRRAMLITTLTLMGLASAAIGVIPSHRTIGFWAPVLLVILRVLQGIAVGGEWGGSVVLALEWGDPRRRGFIGSWPQMGVPIGLILATGAVRLFSSVAGKNFISWGWRVPFLLSLVILAVGYFIRRRVLESPLFEQVREDRQIEKAPAWESIKRDWRGIALSAFLRMSEQAPFYIFTAFILEYGTSSLGFNRNFLLNAVLVAAAVSLFTIPFAGHVSDLAGRQRIYVIGAIVTGIFGIPYFLLLDTKIAALVFFTIVISLIPHDIQYGPQAAYIAESFGTRRRYSGAGMGYQFASVIAGGPAPLFATYLLHTFNSAIPIGIYIIGCAVVTIAAAALLGDRTRADLALDTASYPREPRTATSTASTA